ncbi:hypothetical protein [Bartonella acomydis]
MKLLWFWIGILLNKNGKRSAILMHLARENSLPTEEYIALARCDMERLLP